MTSIVRSVLQAIYASKQIQCVVSLTGGGGSAIGEVLGTSGASSTLLEVIVPYHRQSMIDFLKVPPSELETMGFSSQSVANLMGKKALEHARRLVSIDQAATCVGIGCTAALVSSEPRRGSHRAFLSVHTANAIHNFKLELEKGARTRKEEDECVGYLIVLAMAKAANVDSYLQTNLRQLCTEHTGDVLTEDSASIPSTFIIPTSKLSTIAYLPYAPPLQDMPWRRMLIVPGSFNPMHIGHTELGSVAQATIASITGNTLPILFELSIQNADKGVLNTTALQKRVEAIVQEHAASVVLTNASLFLDKASLFPTCTFAIGADTAVRLLDLKYYNNDKDTLWLALAQIAELKCSFVVAGRDVDGSFVPAEAVVAQVPSPFKHLFIPIPESQFRHDISSSMLRSKNV
ncbi:hypothetical protein THRCLA_01219 [Thraustotheca clavata]|uniref:CinA C-terminal domain-containing protein n=1 Tax=Thraustotheca clavata TaxID=74557 RepID=A0A1W0A8Z0_9STRA|nr:hypothetical protein THRCLA_01219 [Thraustotheca clavata]